MDTASRQSLALLIAVTALIVGSPRSAAAQVDFSGEWRILGHEDTTLRAGVTFGEYVGLPINAAARRKAETWDPSLHTVPERQCIPHPMQYVEHSFGMQQIRFWKVVDPTTQQLIAWRKRGTWMEPERTIWMDGRPHPPEHAAHEWQGFSTGRWEGNMLTVTTTHLKTGWIQMNGVTSSDRATVTEHFVRHGNYLTNITLVHDPVYLTEPFARTSTWVLDPSLQFRPYPCGPNEVVLEIDRPAGTVPHHLPGANPWRAEYAVRHGLPLEAAQGGAETMYPEYMEKLRTLKPATPRP